jgi:formate hydrogenlyase subunit 3/multisubunit Na+/H+ antiporter MnhD subunit
MTVAVAVLLPLLTALLATRRGRPAALGRRLAPLASAALLVPLLSRAHVDWPWALLGLRLGVEPWVAPYALLTAVAWSLAAWFAYDTVVGDTRRFWLGWSLSLWGMVLVVLAQSLVAFYLGYVAVSLAAYLMIVHARSDAAWRAGRIYLVLAFAGEAAIVSGVLILAGYYGNVELALLATPEFAAGLEASRALLLVGFAVKLGIVPLHVWLPLAHPIAPVPASAILSGVIVKAGLLGWLKLAPVQGIDAAAAAPWLVALGLVTAFGGALLGLTQAKLKTVLAYSTISQMGLVLVAYAALAFAADAAVALAALGLLALHHGLTKAALFLACGCAPGASRARSLLLAVPALSLAAAPLTTGYLAKTWLKRAVDTGIELGALPDVTYTLVALSSTATALLMWRAWRLALRERDEATALHPAWALLTLAASTLPWTWAAQAGLLVTPSLSGSWAATWPLLLALALVVAARATGRPGLRLPEGDVVVWVERATQRERSAAAPTPPRAPRPVRSRVGLGRVVAAAEAGMRELPAVGLAMLLVGVVLALVLWAS